MDRTVDYLTRVLHMAVDAAWTKRGTKLNLGDASCATLAHARKSMKVRQAPAHVRGFDYTTNAAFCVAAAERKQGAVPGELQHVKHQIEVALVLVDEIRSQSCADIADLAVASPGHINIAYRCGPEESGKGVPTCMVDESDHGLEPTRDLLRDVRHSKLDDRVQRHRRTEMPLDIESCTECTDEDPMPRERLSESPRNRRNLTGTSAHIRRPDQFDVSGVTIETESPVGHVFSVTMVPSRYDREAHRVFQAYQRYVHGSDDEEISENSYRRFLVDTPILQSKEGNNYGSFHMRYTLDGKLFAVGVVDVLPHCLSSVYLFYDPEFAFLSPGVLSALTEIDWVGKHVEQHPDTDLRFYFMGYLIPNCPKMQYKASFRPSELLCEETGRWIPVPEAMSALETTNSRTNRLRIDPEPERSMFDDFTEDKSWFFFRKVGFVRFPDMERMCRDDFREVERTFVNQTAQLKDFIKLAGGDVARRVVHVI
eukprot:Plantae.Rhodophyta-Rhodochaete_pulchella.ctg53676.p1 GENE.Plantae.Rhodophyta-Rhodochaete_pulchella.ctg53676~~Plantae.Rhodophyta-Rhodochaete_pulchella.ctg53676.p1  ORF type:complete len:498 (+),score=62.99 Plantae.Rhodophyta-Rhodochaete_pulchella.ctg53676:50-1495(+)